MDRLPMVESLWGEACVNTILQQDDVRIEPHRVHFTDAYEGRHFTQRITIQNCGKCTAFVRVGQPSSFALELSPIVPRGEHVPPGLILRRNLKYVFSDSAPVRYATIPYYVNEKVVTQKVRVAMLSSHLSCDRYHVNFGQIDVGPTPTSQSFTLTNSGSKSAKFAMDISKNETKLIINPVKGNIEPHASIVFSIEVVCVTAGKFDAEIWIKSQDPIRILVTGKATVGQLEICNKDIIEGIDFAIFDFPKSYYGAKTVVRIVLKNNSTSRGIFCILAKLNKTLMQIEEAEKIQPAYKCFQIQPMEGRIGPREAIIITATFEPNIKTKLHHFTNEDDHRLALYHIKKLKFCKDIYVNDYPGGQFSMAAKGQDLNRIVNANDMLPFPDNEPLTTIQNRYQTASDQKLLQNIIDTSFNAESALDVCLHADVEQPHIICNPNEITILNMKMNETERRTIQFRNLSLHLPIFLRYEKQPYIEVVPKFLHLKPQQSSLVVVYVTPAKFGTVKCNIVMELLFYNQPRYEFQGYVSVGQQSVGMTFTVPAVTSAKSRVDINADSKEIKPKRLSNEEYVKSNPIIIRNQEIGSKSCPPNKVPSLVLTQPKSYKSIAMEKKRINKLPEYDVTVKNVYCGTKLKSAFHLVPNDLRLNGLCHLTPYQMNNISIEPRHLNIGRVAAYTKITKSFKVHNKNDIPISISMMPEKQRFTFPGGDDRRIEPRQVAEIAFNFFSEFEGLHSLCIRIVVNRNHVYTITMQVQVVARALSLDLDKISFGNNDHLYGYINVRNTLNVPLSFNWDTSNSSCIISPKKGSVGAGKDMTCTIEFNEKKIIPTLQDVSLVTENTVKSRIYIDTRSPKLKLDLSTNIIKFGSVPLNNTMTKCLVLKNDSIIALQFKVANPTPVDGITVAPKLGRVPSKGIMIFKITLQAKRSIVIDANVNLILNQTDYLQFKIFGHVVLPKLVIRPSSIHFKKIPISSFAVAEFYVHNKGNVASTIRFPSKKLQEWRILQSPTDNESVTEDLRIEPKNNICLYILYTPVNITNHWFYLPVIIDGCIGDIDDLFSLPSRIKMKEFARTHNCVPNLKLFNVAYASTIDISKLHCNFIYYPYDPDKTIVTDQVSIFNISTSPIKFCMRLEDLGTIFSFVITSEHVDTGEKGHTILFTLEADDEIFLTATYHPESVGRHLARVPIYLQHDIEENIHNYITLSGYYKEPLMNAEKKVYFGMLPLNIHMQKRVVIEKTYHNAKECKVMFDILDSANLSCSLEVGSREINEQSTNLDILTIKYWNYTSDSSFGRILVRCTCGCSCEIQVLGSMENSILTNYCYLHYITHSNNLTVSKCSSGCAEDELFSVAVMEEISPFPFFPNEQFENEQIFLEAIIAVEDWLFDFGSCGMTRHLVPESLRYIAPPTDAEVMSGSKYYHHVVTYIELLEVLCGATVIEEFNNRCPIDPINRVLSLQCLYTNVLRFLLTWGGSAPHISPEFLLDYEEYELYKKQKDENGEILTTADFDSISKQCWLDLLLQTIKVFIVGRIRERSSDNLAEIIRTNNMPYLTARLTKSTLDIDTFYKTTTVSYQNYFSSEESLLLKWLDYHYCTNILSICPSCEQVSSRHRFQNFNDALEDSTALATVIVRYCPYLKEDLLNLYWQPTLAEENFHNAANVLQTLIKVNNCFTIYPEQLCGRHEIKKLLFVAYLYDFLPTLEPIETIDCKAPLSQPAHVKIMIRNNSDVQKEYKAILFGNTLNVFQLKKSVYLIEPFKSACVNVTYMAKFVKPVSCTLLLSGETKKQRLGSSICYKLNGIPDILYMTSSFKASVEQYSFKYVTIKVKSPYSEMGTFEIYRTIKEPTDAATLEITPLSDIMAEFKVTKLNSFESYLVFDNDGLAEWTLLAMAFTMSSIGAYFYMRNDKIGDFAIKIDINTEPCKRYEEIEVNVPSDIHKKHCICYTVPNQNCCRYVKIKIPRINSLLRTFYNDSSREIYIRLGRRMDIFNSPNSSRIISHVFNVHKHKTAELILLKKIITEPCTFNVSLLGETSENVKVSKTFRIEHVDESGSDNILFHINGQLKDGIMLHLLSQIGQEIRIYKLKFVYKTVYKKIDNI